MFDSLIYHLSIIKMKKGLITLAILLGTSVLTNAKGQADPVLMTVGGKPVTLSEFEYLYHKNNAQQSTPQDIEEYLKLFVPYRQKVAAAEALGLDKTESFEKEFNTYRHDLAAPYMIDQAVEDSIYAAQYERMKEDVDVSHIMIFYQSPGRTAEQKKAVMDSLLNCVNAGENFADLATRFSEDKGSARNGGRMGFISANRFPATFENAAYTLADGEHSGVITTPYGYHIVKVNAHRPARGQVLVEHILRLTRGKSDEEAAAQRQYIDSLYTLVSNGADFETVARENSEDPGSATQGGKLPWFGTGKMVPEFEDVAFSLENNAISQPFATAYGYHIIKRLDGKDIESFDQAKGTIKNAISRDERGQLASRRRLDQLQTKFGVKKDEKAIANVKKQIAVAGVDSALLASFKTSNTTIAKFGKNKVTLADVITNELPNGFAGKAEDQATQFDNAIKRRLDAMTVEAEETALMNEEPSYRNLVNEYRDGMLMFEIQDRNVWTKAKADQEGLEKFFQDNKANYSNWESPKFKSRIIFAESDSLLQEIDAYVKANNIPADSLATALRAKYGKNVKVERVLAAKGENAITDYLGFGGEKPEAQGRWNSYEAYEPKMIDQPEEAIDVRGAVITDYQDYLLNQWLEELDKQYPAVVNQKVLSQAK
jgi:peptidyl-prolyl cis-trans isomerase SurA